MIKQNKLRFHIDEVAKMHTATSKVTTKGQIVIPKRIREKYGIHPATSIRWVEKKEGILMIPESEDPITAARGMLKGSGIFQVYLQEKKKEIAREEIQFARTEQHRTR